MAFLQNQSNLIELKVIETVRNLSGALNNFVAESTILNALQGFNQAAIGQVLGNLVQMNRLEMFVPLTQACGSGGCGGCGRYYRIKIG